MISDERKKEILEQAKEVNSESEKYQLVHALSAIENMVRKKMCNEYQAQLDEVKKKLRAEKDKEQIEILIQEAKNIRKESGQKNVKIYIDYLKELEEGNATTTRLSKNTFRIALPTCMTNIRKTNGEIDIEKMKKLRILMAHELGHIVLHADLITSGKSLLYNNKDMEDEADYFATEIIRLRRERNDKIYANRNYLSI